MSPSPPSAPQPAIGSTLGGYRLQRRIAEGGMGAVYEAEGPGGARVALKVLHGEYSSDADVRRRFRRESSVLSALTHPSIVRILDFGADEHDRCFTAMELLDGSTLRARLDDTAPVSTAELVEIAGGIAGALGAAHAHGVIHGDLKPANVFLQRTAAPRVKLLDFGLSKVLGLDRLTRTGEIMGTPAYMAPELLTGEGQVDPTVDTYGLSVILYEGIARSLPFRERHPGRLMFDVVMGKATPLSEAAPGAPARVAAVIAKGMSVRRTDRFKSASELVDAFRQSVGDSR